MSDSPVDLWDKLPGLQDFVTFDGMWGFFNNILTSKVMTLWTDWSLQWPAFVYSGAVVSMAMSFVSAAYVIVQSTQAVAAYTAPFFEGYYYQYAGASALANDIGLYELISFILWALFSLSISVASMYMNGKAWKLMDDRTAGVKVGGSGGLVLDPLSGAKIFTLQMIAGLMSIIGGFALGDTADNLLTWWDSYSDDERNEGSNKKTGRVDADGTSVEYDFLYHYLTMAFGYITFGTIAAGGFWFMNNFMKVGPVTSCKTEGVLTQSQINQMVTLFGKAVASPEACYEYLPPILTILDVNKDGFISRCEDAQFLMHIGGNDREYSINYGGTLPVAQSTAVKRCNQIFNPLF